MPLSRSSSTSSTSTASTYYIGEVEQQSESAAADSITISESESQNFNTPKPNKNNHHISELATQFQQLQTENKSQSSQIASLKRQINILAEFKGFSSSGVESVGLKRALLEQLQQEANCRQEEEEERIHFIMEGSSAHDSTAAATSAAGESAGGPSTPSNKPHHEQNPNNLSISINPTISMESNDSNNNPLASSTGSLLNQFQQQAGHSNIYDDYDEEHLKEFAKIASPKVSELLNEQAIALDDLLHTSGWSSSDDDDDDDDDDDYHSKRRNKHRRNKNSTGEDYDEDSMNEEWNQLEAAQLDLNAELEAATNGFAQMLTSYNNEQHHEQDDTNSGAYNGGVGGWESGQRNNSQEYEFVEQGGTAPEGTKSQPNNNDSSYHEEWKDSIHQYYAANKNHPQSNDSNGRSNYTNTNTSDNVVSNNIGMPPSPSSSQRPSFPAKKFNHSYTLADHAITLDVSRPQSERGLYIKPLLSHNDLETLSIISLPTYIIRPNGEISSRNRERYMKRILLCAVEYIEPVKSRQLRRLFSGWNPGPGERKPDDDAAVVGGEHRVVNEQQRGGMGQDDAQRVQAFTPKTDDDNDGESSEEDDDKDDNDNNDFVDIDHPMAYAAANNSRPKKIMEPLPIRTVTIRIRPDVLCGAVMDALTVSVEKVGGEMTKRQGGHLRAVLPGRKLRVWLPGEWEREHGAENDVDEDQQNHANGTASVGCSQQALCEKSHDDASSVASGLSAILSPVLGTRARHTGPTYDTLPPYIVDAQLVTKKVGKECQRLVLVRIYRMQDVARVRSTLGDDQEDEEAYDVIAPLEGRQSEGGVEESNNANGNKVDPLIESNRSLKALQEASALVQRIKAVGGSGFAIDPPRMHEGDAATVSSHTSTKSYFKSFSDAVVSPMRYLGGGSGSSTHSPKPQSNNNNSMVLYPTVMELMTKELMRKHVSSPSVGTTSRTAMSAAKQRSHGVYPSLSSEDSPYVKSSWIFLRDCIEELDRRCLAYSTLGTNPAFQFPALPTLDAHFIAQIKAFCRESMIVSLIKTASELEMYAREFEVSCGNVDQLLRPTFDLYKLAPCQLPMPVPLTAYPLDFRVPEELCPPWGPEVGAGLEKICKELVLAASKSQLSSFERAERAISIVVAAFQQQNDVEQGARLGRKNMQVMDRLAKMQAHKRNSIAKLSYSYGKNLLATKAGDEFHALRQKSSNIGSLADVINAVPDEVPLLMCNVLVGSAAGTCYVTHSHILFNTQLVPILGGSKIHLFSIMDVDVTVNKPSKSMLAQLPASISFSTHVYGSKSTREEVYNFIPSIGARRFAKFLEVLREMKLEDPDSLKFSEKGGLIYLAD